jgi:hypothetical protein
LAVLDSGLLLLELKLLLRKLLNLLLLTLL